MTSRCISVLLDEDGMPSPDPSESDPTAGSEKTNGKMEEAEEDGNAEKTTVC